jgi:hypothetical protein
MNPMTGLAVLTGALIVMTAYFAWALHRLAGTIEEMVASTKEMVATTSRTYALSVVPHVECRTTIRDVGRSQAEGDGPEGMVSDTTITNVGPHRFRLSRVRLETDSDGEHIRRFVDRWLVTNESETVQIPFAKATRTKVFVHLEDVAGESHVVVPEHDPGPQSSATPTPSGTGQRVNH